MTAAPTPADKVTCEQCGKVFTKAWSDEEADAEAAEIFTPEELEDVAIICHECWLAIMAWMAELPDDPHADAAQAALDREQDGAVSP